jgi:hypothetical protein
LENILTLQNFKDYRNLARTPAHELSTGENRRNFFHNVSGGGPLKFLSIIRVQSCNLVEPLMNSALGKPQKSVQGSMIEGEYERSMGTIGMIINKKEFRAPLYKDNLSFTTAFGTGDSGVTFCFVFYLRFLSTHIMFYRVIIIAVR